MGGTCSTHGRWEKYRKFLLGKCAGNRPPVTTALGSNDNIKMAPKANSWQNIDLLHLARELHGLTKAVMHFGLT